MGLTFEKELDKQKFVVNVDDCNQIIDYQAKMLLNNSNEHLAAFNIIQNDDKIKFYYNIAGKITLEKYLSKNLLSKKDLVCISNMIVKCFVDCKELMIDYHKLLLDIENVYIGNDGKDLTMIYLPINDAYKNSKENMVAILNKLISNLNKNEYEATNMTQEVILFVNSNNFNVFELPALLKKFESDLQQMKVEKQEFFKEKGEINSEEVSKTIKENIFLKLKTPIGIAIQLTIFLTIVIVGSLLYIYNLLFVNIDKFIGLIIISAAIDYLIMDKLDIKSMFSIDHEESNGMEEEITYNSEKTMVLSKIAYLKSLDDDANEIVINKPNFLIGKNKIKVDFCIDNATISRHHAEIIESSDGYCIRDLGSKNGTYVNEDKLETDQVRRLEDEDIIRFSNQSYKFKVKN